MPGIRSGAARAITIAVLCAAPWVARADPMAAYPEPELRAPLAISEAELDALPPGDPRRGAVLVGLAVRRHAEASEALGQEQIGHEPALAQWRASGAAEQPAPIGTRPTPSPRADALRAQAVSYAQRALDEAPSTPELPDALIAGGLDAERLGRTREALRLLGALLRRFPASLHVGDAWLALGEHHVRNDELTRARVALEEAQKRGRPAVRAWAASRMAELTARVGAR